MCFLAQECVEPLQANVVDLSEMALGEGGADVAVVVAWMRSNPSGLTRLKIDVPKANAEVVAALHALVAQTATLVDLDAMDGRALTLNVLQLNGTEKVKSMDLSRKELDLSRKELGPVSAAIIGACIQVNPILESLKCAACPLLDCLPLCQRPLTHERLLSHRPRSASPLQSRAELHQS